MHMEIHIYSIVYTTLTRKYSHTYDFEVMFIVDFEVLFMFGSILRSLQVQILSKHSLKL